MKESQTLEFKKSLAEINEILETISAFSNTKGGKILVGVEENKDGSIKEVVGVAVKGKEIENLTNEIKQNTDPVIFPSVELVKMNRKEVLSITVGENESKPVFAKNMVFKRVGKTNKKLSSQEIRVLTKESVGYSYTELICKGATLKDIDEEKVKWFLRKAKSERNFEVESETPLKEALVRLKLMKEGKLTNAAVLLFGKNPQDFFLQIVTKAIRFQGIGVTGEMLDFKTLEGSIVTQLIKAEEFIFGLIPKKAWIEEGKLERQEKWLYPPKAIREALANAFAHRDYAASSSVQIRIFDDRLEIWNPGRLPPELNIELLKKKHESIPQNPLIAKSFFLIKWVEEVGTGTNKIITWCKDWGLPEPSFEETGTSLVLTFNRYFVPESILGGLTNRQRSAVEFLKQNEVITNKDYQELAHIAKATATRELAKMVEKGIIIKSGETGKGTFYVLKGSERAQKGLKGKQDQPRSREQPLKTNRK